MMVGTDLDHCNSRMSLCHFSATETRTEYIQNNLCDCWIGILGCDIYRIPDNLSRVKDCVVEV